MSTKKNADIAKLTFEQSMSELEEIVSVLERGEADLDKAMDIYTRGQALKAHCSKKLGDARLRVDKITVGNVGDIALEPFEQEE